MTIGHYLRSIKKLAGQWTSSNFRDERRQRLYMKDIDCPEEWFEELRKVIPPGVFYLNNNVTEKGDGLASGGGTFGVDVAAAPAPAGDLMACLPEPMRAQNLMCYIGHEGTYTPAHREMCASLGQNIMVEASSSINGEKPGSSIWFMTETKDREVVREYFLSMLGHDIEIEKHFAQINAWKKATFPVYVVEQRQGDFILVPPLAAHQVWNRGTRTVKVAWNRTTMETLEMALKEALPKARLVCRDEQYKNKAMIYFALQRYAAELNKADVNNDADDWLGQDIMRNSARAQQLKRDFKGLFSLFTTILTDEMFAFPENNVEFIEFDSFITCSYCRSNIFNRFLTCKHCVRLLIDGDEDSYDICIECYAMGRSCLCISNLQWCEQWSWSELMENYEKWRAMIVKNDGYLSLEASPLPIDVERVRKGKKSLAQICQEALRRRPFNDITKPQVVEEPKSASEPEVDDEGRVKKKKQRKPRKKKRGELRRCHVCCHKDYAYKVAECTNPGCSEAYCYGVLYRAFDLMPQAVLENEHWQCPKCLNICNCGACRRAGNTDAYMPKNTLLGHDTRSVADDRSVDSLVDFRMHNLTWLKAFGEESRSKDSKRMKRLQAQADVAKSQEAAAMQPEDPNQDAHVGEDTTMDAANGHGDHSHVLGLHGHDNGAVPTADISGNNVAANGAVATDAAPMATNQPADVNTMRVDSTNEFDLSAYPDPDGLMHHQRLIGMGYYEQDDSPDKILFDQFQMPPADAMKFGELDVPEYLKNQLRAAKRKARHENDDPDFMLGGRHVKKRKDDEEDIDPALFSMLEAFTGEGNDAVDEPATQPTDEGMEAEEETPGGQLLFPANVPALRHARPLKSYADDDDELGIDDTDDLIASWDSIPHKGKGGSKTKTRSLEPADLAPTDLASAAIRALGLSEPDAPESAEAASTTSTTAIGRRRGRPPKRSQDSESPGSPLSTPAREASATSDSMPRRRGRPPKSRLSNVIMAGDVDASGGAMEAVATEHGGDNGSAAELEKELEVESPGEEADDDPPPAQEAPVPKKRGRPPRSSIPQTTHKDTDSGEPVKKVPGRPRNLDATIAAKTGSVASFGKFMSMADRLKARGGKFKLRGRKPAESASAVEKPELPGKDEAKSRLGSRREPADDKSEASGKEESSSGESGVSEEKFPSPPKKRMATIVRLGDLTDENTQETGESSSDDEIPATIESGRGRGSVRGGQVLRGAIRGRVRPRRELDV